MTRILLLVSVAATMLLATSAWPVDEPKQDDPYQDYAPAPAKQLYFELVYDDDVVEVIVPGDPAPGRYAFDRDAISTNATTVSVNGQILFDGQGLRIDGATYPLQEITDSRVRLSGDETVMSFYTRSPDDLRIESIRRGNIIEPFDTTIVVEEGEFVRGMILTVTGNIEVYGEVNKDVISLFGEIFVAPGATVRGDIVAMTGRADVGRDAAIYGEVYSGDEGIRGRKHRFRRDDEDLTVAMDGAYNRVDGYSLQLGLRYTDSDTVLPSVWAMGGYAFESELWRYDFGLEQVVWKKRPLTIGGSIYRQLRSEDTWLLSEGENTAMAFIAGEDFMDYYQAEGGHVSVKFRPNKFLNLQSGYRFEDLRYLEAERDLWSLFGGSKKFGYNFASVPPELREAGAEEIDTSSNGAVFANFMYDTRDTSSPFTFSAWTFAGELEWSSPDFESDFDYRRYRLTAIRYQRLNRRLMLIVRGMFAASDGNLPMHKQYFLGGVGSLHGYKHKEYTGSRFWMVNTEYRMNFPRTELAVALSWDVGQISQGTAFSELDEVKNSLGMSVYLGDDVKVTLAKRMDRSEDDNPRFSVRLAHAF